MLPQPVRPIRIRGTVSAASGALYNAADIEAFASDEAARVDALFAQHAVAVQRAQAARWLAALAKEKGASLSIAEAATGTAITLLVDGVRKHGSGSTLTEAIRDLRDHGLHE